MKKLLGILFVLLLIGCASKGATTPTKEVKDFLSKYTSLDNDVTTQLESVINTENLTDSQKDEYKKVFERQYKNLKYEVKDEQINDNNATVTVEIEIYDLYAVKQASDTYLANNPNEFNNAEGTFDESKFWDYKIDKMKNATERRKYTLDLTLTKIDNMWRLDNLLDSELQMIHGLYIE